MREVYKPTMRVPMGGLVNGRSGSTSPYWSVSSTVARSLPAPVGVGGVEDEDGEDEDEGGGKVMYSSPSRS